MKRISFLIPAHNEEKSIKRVLNNIINIPYTNWEVLVGLDGCTDRTEQIVKHISEHRKKIKYFKMESRKGKPEVIDALMKHVSGEIIIIHDADWKFLVKDKQSIEKLVKLFDIDEVGGVADAFPIQYPIREQDFLSAGVGLHSLMWMSYAKEQCIATFKDWGIANPKAFPMLVNIFRKECYAKNKTLGDDFERFFNICSQDKAVLFPMHLNLPRMVSLEEHYTIKSLFNQKVRTALARKQIGRRMQGKLGWKFVWYVMNFRFDNFRELCAFIVVSLVFISASLKAKFMNPISTKEGWSMRLQR